MGKNITIQKILSILLGRLKFIIAAGVLMGLLFFLYSNFIITPMYTTSTMIYIQNFNRVDKDSEDSQNNSQVIVRNADGSISSSSSNNAQAQKIFSSDISGSASLASVCVTLFQNSDSITSLFDGCDVTIAVTYDTFYITITATGADPIKCANVANSVAEKCKDVFYERFQYGQIGVIREAKEPSAPISPNKMRNTLIGVAVGLVLSILISVLLELIDTTLKVDDDVQALYGIPVFAEIPDFESESR